MNPRILFLVLTCLFASNLWASLESLRVLDALLDNNPQQLKEYQDAFGGRDTLGVVRNLIRQVINQETERTVRYDGAMYLFSLTQGSMQEPLVARIVHLVSAECDSLNYVGTKRRT